MKTISALVEDYIKSKPFLQTALSDGIINLTSLARIIRRDIQKNTDKAINLGAIVMSLKRHSESLEFVSTHKIIKILKNISEISVKSKLTDYCFELTSSFLFKQSELLQEIGFKKDVFFATTRGIKESSIIVSSELQKHLEKKFKNEKMIQKFEDLGAISIKLPEENVSVSGVYYFIFQRLAWEGININEIISTLNEFTIIVPENQIDSTLEIIKNLKNL